MRAAVSYPHIDQIAGQSPRLARLPRIRVAQIVMDYLAHAWSPEEICRQHPHLTRAEVHSAMAYYYDHQAEIDEEIRKELEAVDQARAQAGASPQSLVSSRSH
jgi:uncharacterized protein (DUF433 family)